MKILVDTHILLWILFDSSNLTDQEKEIILNQENEIHVSTVSL